MVQRRPQTQVGQGSQTSQCQPLFTQYIRPPKIITEMMGVSYMEPWQHSADPTHFYANSTPLWNEVRSVAGYDYLGRFNLSRTNGRTGSSVITIGPRRYELFWRGDEDLIELKDGQQTLVTFDLGPFLERNQQQTADGSNHGLPEELMSLEGESASARIKLRFEGLTGRRDGSDIRLDTAHGEVLLKIKERTPASSCSDLMSQLDSPRVLRDVGLAGWSLLFVLLHEGCIGSGANGCVCRLSSLTRSTFGIVLYKTGIILFVPGGCARQCQAKAQDRQKRRNSSLERFLFEKPRPV